MAQYPSEAPCPKEAEEPGADPAQAQAEHAGVTASELPEPEFILGWDDLPRPVQNTEPRYKVGDVTAQSSPSRH